MALADEFTRERPMLRGVSHVGATIAAMLGAPLLLLVADSPRAYVGGAIFATSLILLYGTSAAYHHIAWTPLFRAIISRLDHSMVLVLIAGTYTPLCLVVLSNAWGITMLSVVWGVAGAGIITNLARPATPRWLRVTFYVILGWLALASAGELAARLSASPLALLVLGGVLYTVSGIVYAVRKPDPWPRVFGHLEVFHLLVIAGSALHYSLVAIYVLPS
ncbi:MAG: hemolysin III family protein [Dehalococcoidia bacterium]|nr:MAG: hemolysin III family protein [Dehalococcoidia bacterium]